MPDSVRGFLITAALGAATVVPACRGRASPEPPLHLNLDMDQQKRFEGQEENPFFDDGRAMRPPVPGTIARGELHDDDHLYRGRVGGEYAELLPMPVDRDLLLRGQSRFEIFCAPCHDRAGTGAGLVVQRGIKQGMVAPPDFYSARVRAMPVGQLFATISGGVRDMPAYERQMPVADRWATVAYVRVLQASRNAAISAVPAAIAEQKGWTGVQAPAPEAGPAPGSAAKGTP